MNGDSRFIGPCSGSILIDNETSCAVQYLPAAYYDYLDTLPPTTTGGYSWNYNLGSIAGYDPYTFLKLNQPGVIQPTNFVLQPNSVEKVFEAIVMNNGMAGGSTKPFFDWKFPVNEKINLGTQQTYTDASAANYGCSHLLGTESTMSIGICAEPGTGNYYMKLELGMYYSTPTYFSNQNDLYNSLITTFGIATTDLICGACTGSEWNADGYLSNFQELRDVLLNNTSYMSAPAGLIKETSCCSLPPTTSNWCYQWSGGTHPSQAVCVAAPVVVDCACNLPIPWVWECCNSVFCLGTCMPTPSGTPSQYGGVIYTTYTACTQNCTAYWDCGTNGCTGPAFSPTTPYLTENACKAVCVHYDCDLTALQGNVSSWIHTIGELPYFDSLSYPVIINFYQFWSILYNPQGWVNGTESPYSTILKNSGGVGPFQGTVNDAFAHIMQNYPKRDLREAYFVNTGPDACVPQFFNLSNIVFNDPICPYSEGIGCWNTVSYVGILLKINGFWTMVKSYHEIEMWLGNPGCLNLPNPSIYDWVSLQSYMLSITNCVPAGWSSILNFDRVEIHPDKVLCYNGISCDCIEQTGTGPGLWWQANYNDCKNHITQPAECCDIWFPSECTCCESNLPVLAISSGWTHSIVYSGPLDSGNEKLLKYVPINSTGSYKLWLNECVQLTNVWSPTQSQWTDCCACCVVSSNYSGPIPMTSINNHSCNVNYVNQIGGMVFSSLATHTDWVSCGVDEDCVSCAFPAGTILG